MYTITQMSLVRGSSRWTTVSREKLAERYILQHMPPPSQGLEAEMSWAVVYMAGSFTPRASSMAWPWAPARQGRCP
jgi:hypothetical protein